MISDHPAPPQILGWFHPLYYDCLMEKKLSPLTNQLKNYFFSMIKLQSLTNFIILFIWGMHIDVSIA